MTERINLYVGMPNEKLKECYNSYVRIQINKRNKNELFDDMIDGYLPFVEKTDEHKKEKIAFALASGHMFNEIARRYFKVYDGFNELVDRNSH